jgi:hypothetical protein
MSNGLVSIYALAEGPNDPPRYVGKTMHWLHQRYRAHISEARKGTRRPVYTWIRKLLQQGKEPTLVWLENVKSNEDWQERESYWISKFRAEGVDLLNLTDGGEGVPGARKSRLQRAKMALRRRTGEMKHCLACGRKSWVKRNYAAKGYGNYCSIKCKARHQGTSDAWKKAGNPASAAARRAMTRCGRGHPWSEENTYLQAKGRMCKQCAKVRRDAWRAERRRVGLPVL